jgi:hypothetical protein
VGTTVSQCKLKMMVFVVWPSEVECLLHSLIVVNCYEQRVCVCVRACACVCLCMWCRRSEREARLLVRHTMHINRVGQDHKQTYIAYMYMRYFWQGHHHTYGHVRRSIYIQIWRTRHIYLSNKVDQTPNQTVLADSHRLHHLHHQNPSTAQLNCQQFPQWVLPRATNSQTCTHATYLGSARTIYIYGVYTVLLAGTSPNVWSYTAYIYGSGQPLTYPKRRHTHTWSGHISSLKQPGATEGSNVAASQT